MVSRMYGHIGCATNNEAKIRALEAGLLLCKEKGLTNVQIEGDSQIIINGVTSNRLLNWKLAKWLPRIQFLLQAINPYEISNIHREGNRVANLLENVEVNSYAAEVSVDPKTLSSEITNLCKKDLSIRKCDGVG
ncbi:uncharacterized protein LOC131858134 [Cryptomeria japonica]|uniref:uncharacterized protein LOC131858134 n=1 Tax=Cryptomeria japonica TaxID=3369 RepID=UPI0027DA854E|nr:uncharacterized protein LOC131858134 [Cryptomeria japonica]